MYIHHDCGLSYVSSKFTPHVRISELALDFNIKGNRASPNVRSVLGPNLNVTPKPAFVLRLTGYNPTGTRPRNTAPCPTLPTSAGRAFGAVES